MQYEKDTILCEEEGPKMVKMKKIFHISIEDNFLEGEEQRLERSHLTSNPGKIKAKTLPKPIDKDKGKHVSFSKHAKELGGESSGPTTRSTKSKLSYVKQMKKWLKHLVRHILTSGKSIRDV